jgi:hypothetical protein
VTITITSPTQSVLVQTNESLSGASVNGGPGTIDIGVSYSLASSGRPGPPANFLVVNTTQAGYSAAGATGLFTNLTAGTYLFGPVAETTSIESSNGVITTAIVF